MNEKVKEIWEKIKQLFGKVNRKVWILMVAFLSIFLILFLALNIYNKTQYSVLYSGLTSDDANVIIGILNDSGYTRYQFVNGDTIRVPTSQESQMRLAVLMQGYSGSGYGYETYRSAIGTMSTESDRTIAALQDLQDRMSAVIRHMDGVKDAVVTIAPGDDRRFVLDQSNMTAATASVMVTMQPGRKLSSEQVLAIRNLISHSVKGLENSKVSISDSEGNDYTVLNDGASNTSEASYLKLQLEEEVNNTIRTEIRKVLVPLFGDQNVSIAVNSTVDVRHSVGESTQYTEPEWAIKDGAGGRGIIGQQIYDWEVIRDPEDPVGGVVGTETNSDIPLYPEFGSTHTGDESYWSSQGTLNYITDTDKQQTERYAAVVTNLMVAVTINSSAASSVNTNSLTAHIARAAGITAEYQDNMISVFVGPFYQETEGARPAPSDPFSQWMLYAAIAGVALLLLLLILIAVLRRRKSKKKKAQLQTMLNEQLTLINSVGESKGADIMDLRTEKSMELRQNIRQFAEDNPEIAAFMLKNWLREGDQHG